MWASLVQCNLKKKFSCKNIWLKIISLFIEKKNKTWLLNNYKCNGSVSQVSVPGSQLFSQYMLHLGTIISKHGIAFCTMPMTSHTHLKAKMPNTSLNHEECVKDLRHFILCNFIPLASDNTKVLWLWLQAARSELSEFAVTLDGLSVRSSRKTVELVDISLSFDANVDCFTGITDSGFKTTWKSRLPLICYLNAAFKY